nr:MAG TPA: hypothetical protein [Caudoviricetes sp.]
MTSQGCSLVKVFIPSYKRAGRVKTLRVFRGATLVVAESEASAYAAGNQDADIWAIPDAIQGNIARVRNYILDNAEADAVCMLDDDITQFGFFKARGGFGYDRVKLSGEEFERFLLRGTELCDDMGLHLWGVNIQAANRLYHQAEPFSIVKQVLGPFSVHVMSDIRYDENIPLKEDYDLFLRHMQRCGGVLRLNAAWYANAGSSGAKGGCAAQRDIEAEKRQFLALQRKWGSSVVKNDRTSKRGFDFNPVLTVPVRGV